MDFNLLRSWVGLPPGPWPPGDRELLGLPPDGPLDPAAVEAAALDRMARLRTHQLLHPELVTEGMNRVARAMMGAAAAPAPRRKALTSLAPPLPVAVPGEVDLPPTVPDTSLPAVQVLDAVAVEPTEPPVALVAPSSATRPPVELIRIPENVPPPPGLALDSGEVPPHARRAAYRELAGLRAVLRAFDQLRPSVALPGEGLLTPAAVCDLLEAVAAFRAAASHPGLERGFVRTLAPGLTAVMTNPLPLAVFRTLTRSQRQELAREWAAGRAGLVAALESVRLGLDHARRPPDVGKRAVALVGAYPELVLVAASGLVGLVAVVRTAAR